jgi:hypothetical protein
MSASLVSAGLRSHQPEDSPTGQSWPPPAVSLPVSDTNAVAPGPSLRVTEIGPVAESEALCGMRDPDET